MAVLRYFQHNFSATVAEEVSIMYSRMVQLIDACKFATGEKSKSPMPLSSRRQVQLLCTIRKEIGVIRLASNQLLEVKPHAPTDIASKSPVVISIAVIRDITESGARADWAVVLKELRLNCETDPQFATFYTVTHVSEHHVVRVAHSLRPQLP
jgi:hypothetical protein